MHHITPPKLRLLLSLTISKWSDVIDISVVTLLIRLLEVLCYLFKGRSLHLRISTTLHKAQDGLLSIVDFFLILAFDTEATTLEQVVVFVCLFHLPLEIGASY